MRKQKNKFILLAMTCCLLFTNIGGHKSSQLAEVYAADTMSDGTYAIPVSLWNATKNEASMGNSSLEQTGKLVVENGKATLYLKFTSMNLYGMTGYLMSLDLLKNVQLNASSYPVSYDLEASSVVSTFDLVDEYNGAESTDVNCAGKQYPKVVSVPITIGTEYIWAQVYVPVMGTLGFGEQICRIKLDFSQVSVMTDTQLETWESYEKSDGVTEDSTDGDTSGDGATEDDNSSGNTAGDSTATDTDDTGSDTSSGSDASTGTETVTVDKSKLKTAITKANKLLKQTEVYTEATLTSLQSVVNTAQKAYDLATATQTVVDAQVLAVENAIADLAKISMETLDKDHLEDGKYSVYVAIWNATADTASMGNPALNHTALLTVKDEVYTLEISTHPMTVGTITACLQSLQLEQTDGTYEYAEVTAENNTVDGEKLPSAFSMVLPSKEEYINIKIDPKVAVMGDEPLAARLKISWDTLTTVADDTELTDDTDTVVSGVDTPAVDLTDTATGVRITAEKNILAEGVKLKVTQSKTDGSYTLTLYTDEVENVQPTGMVKIYLPVAKDCDAANSVVYRISGSTRTRMTATVKSDYFVFQTSTVGTYLIEETEEANDTDETAAVSGDSTDETEEITTGNTDETASATETTVVSRGSTKAGSTQVGSSKTESTAKAGTDTELEQDTSAVEAVDETMKMADEEQENTSGHQMAMVNSPTLCYILLGISILFSVGNVILVTGFMLHMLHNNSRNRRKKEEK